ncbi:MAG TPA: acetyl-CoA synthase subunit gamma, partial [Spirochaetia bacterium]|nr:acetyl-CoA synthase subunit gamma [Spirochaetia bacterium]
MKLEIKKIEPLLPPVGNEQWIEGSVSTKIGKVGKIKTKLDWKDTLGGFKVRWGMNRMNYRIEPGIYAAGNPSPDSPVLVSANYKLTFDILRKNLSGIDAWVLILDTKGVNVWCAAGKGTFGTKELVNRIKKVHLEKIVSHNTLILPQLGAVGVSAFETAKKSGFKVVYGPVRADDLSEYLKNGLQKTEKMSRVFFHLKDRLAVVPIEL